MPGSIETRSAASGWNDGSSVKTKRAMPRFVLSAEVAGPARADAAAVDHGHARLLGQLRLVRVADQEDERARGRVVLEHLRARADQRRLVDHHDVDLADQRLQPAGELVLLGGVGLGRRSGRGRPRPSGARTGRCSPPRAARRSSWMILPSRVPSARIRPVLGQHDRALAARARARGSRSRGCRRRTRTACRCARRGATSRVSSCEPRSVRSPTKNTGPPLESRSSTPSPTVLLCRSEATVITGWLASERRRPGSTTRRARPTSCASSSWSSTPRGAPRGLDGLQRARDVRAVGVVLRVRDLAARRDQDDQRDARSRAVVSTASPLVHRSRGTRDADREGDQQAERERAGHDQREQLHQVAP